MTGGSSYLICGTPRSGSTLLCSLLADTGVAGRPESYFRGPSAELYAERWRLPRQADGSVSDADYIAAVAGAGTTPNGVFGARIMWGSLEVATRRLVGAGRGPAPRDPAEELALLQAAFGELRCIHLVRDDALAQAVSWARAEQTGHWQDDDPPGGEPVYDGDLITRLIATVTEHQAAWRSWFAAAGVQPILVQYEELSAAPVPTAYRLLAELGLEPPAGLQLAPRHRRQADALSADWTARYLESINPR